MPRSKPFSGKAKKQQLKNKRQKDRDNKNDFDATDALFNKIEENQAKLQEATDQHSKSKAQKPVPKTQAQTQKRRKNSDSESSLELDNVDDSNKENHQSTTNDNSSQQKSNDYLYTDIDSIQNSFGRFFLKLEKLTKDQVEERKLKARTKFYDSENAGAGFSMRKITWPDFPHRPNWSKNMSPTALELSEQNYFVKFINSLPQSGKIISENGKENDDVTDTSLVEEEAALPLNKFEHNLETWRQLWRVIEKSNVIAIVTDVRFPHLTLADSLLNYLKDLNKPVVLLLNKCDLVPPETLGEIYNYYTNDEFYKSRIEKVVLFTSPKRDLKLSKKHFNFVKDHHHLGPADLQDYLLERFDITGWKECDGNLCRLPEALSTDFELRSEISSDSDSKRCNLGFLGFPNVGKSSVMNRLVGKKITRISATPGATKYFQTYFPEGSRNIQLIDCPGLVFPARGISFSEQVLAGSYPISQVQEPYTTVGDLIEQTPILNQLNLEKLNRDPKFDFNYDFNKITAWQVCELYAQQKGFYTGKGGGTLDCYKAANQILRNVLNGHFDVYSESYSSREEGQTTAEEGSELGQFLANLREEEEAYLKEQSW